MCFRGATKHFTSLGDAREVYVFFKEEVEHTTIIIKFM